MDKFKWGLYPEAPKEIVDLVTRYRSATPQGKKRCYPRTAEGRAVRLADAS